MRSDEINVQWNGHGYTFYPPDFPLKMIRVFYEDLPPLGHNIEHKHLEEAVVYIVRGHGHAFIGGAKDEERATTIGVEIPFKAGDFLMVPSNIWHVFYNDDEKEWVRFLGILNPLLTYIGLASTHHHGHEAARFSLQRISPRPRNGSREPIGSARFQIARFEMLQ